MTVLDNAVVGRVNDHTHAPNATQMEVAKERASIKRKALTTHDTPQAILTTELANVSNEAAVNLPPMRHIRRAIRSQRENFNAPNIPQHRRDLPAIPNEYAITAHGDRVLLHDSGPGDDSRIILFATGDALETPSSSDHWFGDGTFKVSPSICFLLYTIHAIRNEQIMPCVFALLLNKTQITYGRLFGEITQHMQGHIPTEFLLDFEKAAMNGANINFNGVDIKGCFFHLCSNIWKRFQNSRLKWLYENDQEFSTLMRMVASLACVPIDVPRAFYDLEADIRLNYNNHNGVDAVLDYVEDTYIGRQRRGRPCDIPMFPIQIWNMYDRTFAQLPRSNNNVEGWYKRFQTTCGCVHPNIWKFINILQNEEP